jgi:cell division transport system permease protein
MSLRRKPARTRTVEARGRKNTRRGDATIRQKLTSRLRAYAKVHLQAMIFSLGRISRNPVSSLMTIAVIAIALAMPSGLHLLLKNFQGVSAGWDNAAQVSLFLKQDIAGEAIERLQDELTAMPEVDRVTKITPDQALAEFRRLSDFGDALKALDDNPFPTVLLVEPTLAYSAPAAARALLQRLQGLSGVDVAQLDMEWVERWYALMEIGKRAVLILAILLAMAVLLIIGNTIRLAIQSRRDEIEVQKLIGASDAFIRRPFLYSGFWHGLFGAVLAWLLVNVSLLMLNGPVQRLSLLYDGNFRLQSLNLGTSLLLLLVGILLGYAGARIAVGRHLRDIEPS